MDWENGLSSLASWTMEDQGYKWVQLWRQMGGRVAGILSPYVPVEVLWAAGFLPWRIGGDQKGVIDLASEYRTLRSCPKDSLILERVLKGELGFIDIVVATDWDQNLRRLCDTWGSQRKGAFIHVLFMPKMATQEAYDKFADEILKLKKTLEDIIGETIREEDLWRSIGVYDRLRRAVRQIYELRKLDAPPLSGAEVLGITLSGLAMPPDRFIQELERLLINLNGRKPPLKSFKPRVLVSSDWLDDPRFIQFIEDMGSLVAMDDLDTGSRFFWGQVGASKPDAITALSRYYLNRPECPRQLDWEWQVEQLATWVKEFRIDGVVELLLVQSPPRGFRSPYLREGMRDRKIPFISVERDYRFSSAGQLGNRIEPFIEMLSQGKDG